MLCALTHDAAQVLVGSVVCTCMTVYNMLQCIAQYSFERLAATILAATGSIMLWLIFASQSCSFKDPEFDNIDTEICPDVSNSQTL